MKTQFYTKCSLAFVVLLLLTTDLFAQPVISGPNVVCTGQTVNYNAPPGMTGYLWSISGGGLITPGATPDVISVTWTDGGQWIVYCTFTDPNTNSGNSLALNVTVGPTITGPNDTFTNLPATLGNGITTGQVYTTDGGMTNYVWSVSSAGTITAPADPTVSNTITVTWTNPNGQQSVSVNYTNPTLNCTSSVPTVLIINYNPFGGPIDPTKVPQFIDPLPHFAAGLRVNAKAGGNLTVKTFPVRQIALSTGTPVVGGIVGDVATPHAGEGNYAGYAISTNGGTTFGPAMWPAQTIEASVGHQLMVQYRNGLAGLNYFDFNILADQTLMMNGFPQTGNILTDPYTGPIPMVVHLHGGEIPSNSDGGPTAWFMPEGNPLVGPGFKFNASKLATYPNQQESGTLWYHPHDQGLTRINVYTGLAGFYFLRGTNEEATHLPGWSGDDKVLEVTPAGKSPTFSGPPTIFFTAPTPYLPEIEVAIQDRMFNVKGELFWPIQPTNPDIHPFWGPEFFGDIMTVNGKTYPYLSVAPRTYRFRLLDGCNARFLNIWLQSETQGIAAPAIHIVGSDGAFLDVPVTLDPAAGQALTIGPGERYDVVIDFTGLTNGVFTLMNNANAPYPDGDPVVPGLTDRIMQFIVNGQLVSAADPTAVGTDKGVIPGNIRPGNPMVKLADFANSTLAAGVTPDLKRQIILNEVTGAGGPVQVLFNNSHFDTSTPIVGAPPEFGGPTEIPLEGTTELIQIINTTVDGHPIHVHLTNWQLVSRQQFDVAGYLAAYSTAWSTNGSGLPEFPVGQGYPGGSGPPYDYNSLHGGAVGGNPDVTPFLTVGTLRPANAQERLWKDDVKAFPGEVATYVVRYAPTDRPINATPAQLLYPFDPSIGPGYVWHCHIIDHEDMDMMRPLVIQPSLERKPVIVTQPSAVIACAGDNVSFSVTATTLDGVISYLWQINDGNGWTDLADGGVYSGVLLSKLNISPASLALNGNLYRCSLRNTVGTTVSDEALLTVNNCSVSGTLKYNNTGSDVLSGFTVSIDGKTGTTDGSGAFTVSSVTSGTHAVTIADVITAGGINSTDAGSVNSWILNKVSIPNVSLLAADVDNTLTINSLDAQGIQNNFVKATPFVRDPWVYWNAIGSGTSVPSAFNVIVDGESVTGFNILGMSTGDFNSSFTPNTAPGGSNVFITDGTTLTVPAGKPFDLPVKAPVSLTYTTVKAISLILNVDASLVTVNSVTVSGSAVPATFNVVGSELRIGWNSTTAVTAQSGQPLVVLNLTPKAAFTSSQTLTITAAANSLNELADGSFTPYINAELVIDHVTIATNSSVANSSALKLSVAPNPTTGAITITYQLPVDGRVTLGIFDSKGVNLLLPLITNINMLAGNYTFPTSVSSLAKGNYYIRITLVGANKTQTSSVKLIRK